MNAFKIKTKSRILVDDRQTLDAKHNNILTAFTENKKRTEELHIDLDIINSKLSTLNAENAKCPILNLKLQQDIWDLDDSKKKIESEIYKIVNNIDEHNYMLKTGKLLSNYYKIIDEEKKIASTQASGNTELLTDQPIPNAKKKHIIDWFQSGSTIITENVDTGKKTLYISKKKTLNEYKEEAQDVDKTIKQKRKITAIVENKDTIYEKYMKLIDKNYINVNNDNVDIFDTCEKCLVEMLLNNNTGLLICPKCGLVETIIVDSDKPSFKEPPKEMTSFCYKRINHLNEFLAQFQAKETTDIHEDVYNEILLEIKKERITNMALITPDKMRNLLKKIRKNDYYEHIPYIINQLNGLPAPVIAPEIEEIIRGMFKAIQIPFEKYCPNKRKNFLSYNYVMYKFFELLELDEYLHCFQLLKSRTKLHQQDQIWKNICKDLNWQFIKSL
jgi:hypothetical protein